MSVFQADKLPKSHLTVLVKESFLFKWSHFPFLSQHFNKRVLVKGNDSCLISNNKKQIERLNSPF